MKINLKLPITAVVLLFLQTGWTQVANAQMTDLAIKNGETLELGPVYYHNNCKSILKGPPSVEILDGPPQLSVSVKEGPVLARAQECAKPIAGGMLMLTATDVTDIVKSTVIVRIKYPTKDGDRYRSRTLRVTMVP